MSNLDLTDRKSGVLEWELWQVVENDRYPFSPRVLTLRGILRLYARTDKETESWYKIAMAKSSRVALTVTIRAHRTAEPTSPPTG